MLQTEHHKGGDFDGAMLLKTPVVSRQVLTLSVLLPLPV
jgi:hypothetical protein